MCIIVDNFIGTNKFSSKPKYDVIFFQNLHGIFESTISIVFSSIKILSFPDFLSPYIISAFSTVVIAFKNALPKTEYSRLFPIVPHKPQNKSPLAIPMKGYTFACFNLLLSSILDKTPFISLCPEEILDNPKHIIIKIPL